MDGEINNATNSKTISKTISKEKKKKNFYSGHAVFSHETKGSLCQFEHQTFLKWCVCLLTQENIVDT